MSIQFNGQNVDIAKLKSAILTKLGGSKKEIAESDISNVKTLSFTDPEIQEFAPGATAATFGNLIDTVVGHNASKNILLAKAATGKVDINVPLTKLEDSLNIDFLKHIVGSDTALAESLLKPLRNAVRAATDDQKRELLTELETLRQSPVTSPKDANNSRLTTLSYVVSKIAFGNFDTVGNSLLDGTLKILTEKSDEQLVETMNDLNPILDHAKDLAEPTMLSTERLKLISKFIDKHATGPLAEDVDIKEAKKQCTALTSDTDAVTSKMIDQFYKNIASLKKDEFSVLVPAHADYKFTPEDIARMNKCKYFTFKVGDNGDLMAQLTNVALPKDDFHIDLCSTSTKTSKGIIARIEIDNKEKSKEKAEGNWYDFIWNPITAIASGIVALVSGFFAFKSDDKTIPSILALLGIGGTAPWLINKFFGEKDAAAKPATTTS